MSRLFICESCSQQNMIPFHFCCRSCTPLVSRARGVRVRSKAGRRGPRRARGRERGQGQGGGAAAQDDDVYLSYEDPDVENVLRSLNPSHPAGVYFGFPLLCSAMNTAVHFLIYFFTVEMIDMIVQCTNRYFWKHIVGESQCNALPDGSWEETSANEIRRLIAQPIYFGLIKVGFSVNRYWSIKSLYHGLWARDIMSLDLYNALMAMLHVVAPAAETPGDKLRKIDTLINYFKSRYLSLYQPRQSVAIHERVVKSSQNSGNR